jgi:pimeloyl-ACP methyl ester carboxylesterase
LSRASLDEQVSPSHGKIEMEPEGGSSATTPATASPTSDDDRIAGSTGRSFLQVSRCAARMIVVEGTGHLLPLEVPDVVAHHLDELVEKLALA